MSCTEECEGLFIGSAYTAKVTVLDPVGAAITNATGVTAQIFDALGNAVGAAVACSHTSNGIYTGSVPTATTALLIEGKTYTVLYTVPNYGTVEEYLVAQRRPAHAA